MFGIPVVATNLLRIDYTNSAAGDSHAMLVHRNAAVIGDRRIFTIKTSDEVLLRSDGLLVVASERIAFAPTYDKAIVLINNIRGV